MSYRPFDVVVAPFPYSDRLAEKRRPALIVSTEALEETLGRVWVVMITSAVDRVGLGDWTIADLEGAGLPAPSIVRASKIATLDANRLIRRAGRLSPDDQSGARAALRECQGF
jgi:mRNA interferase MazF